MSFFGPHTVTRLRPLGVDHHGDPVEGEPDARVIEGCLLYPRGSSEEEGRSATVIVGMVLLAPPGSDILVTDEIAFRGVTYRVDGRPGAWGFLDGTEACLQVALKDSDD